MKRNIKLLVFLIALLLTCNVVHAAKSCDDLISEDAKAACKNVEDYCARDQGGEKGCIYDPTKKKFTQVNNVENSNGTRGTFKSGKAELVRGYTGVDKNGYVVFVGCYKYENPKEQGGAVTTLGLMNWPVGTYFIFKYMTPDKKGNCSNIEYDIVPAGVFGNFDGHEAIGVDGATYKWTATQKGNCPKIFAITGNTTALTASKNKYVFADNETQLKEFNKSQFRFDFWNIEEYVINAGCTVQDKEGYEQAIACYDDAINRIKNKACPSDLSNISTYQEELNELATKCSPDLEILYKNELLKKNAETFTKNLNTAVNDKITSCQYQQCKLSQSNITSLTNVLSSKSCKNGCAGKTGSEYDSCFNCLKSAFNSCGLSETQINCLIETQKQKDGAVSQLEDEIDDDQQQHIQDELDEAQRIREELYGKYSEDIYDPGEVVLPKEDPGLTECKKILGENLSAIVKASITILQIVGAIIAIVKGMMTLIPPILAKDAEALKKASSTLVKMAIILVIIFLFKPLLTFIGDILDFDTSCIV